MVYAGWGKFCILVLYDSKKCIPRRDFEEFCFCATPVLLFSRKVEGAMAHPAPSRLRGSRTGEHFRKHRPYYIFVAKIGNDNLLNNKGDVFDKCLS